MADDVPPRLTGAAQQLLLALLDDVRVATEHHRRRDGSVRRTYHRADSYAACTHLVQQLAGFGLLEATATGVTLTSRGRELGATRPRLIP